MHQGPVCVCLPYFVPHSEEEERRWLVGLGCPGNLRPLTVMNVPFQPGLLQVVSPNDPSHFTKERATCCINPSVREKNVAYPWSIVLFFPESSVRCYFYFSKMGNIPGPPLSHPHRDEQIFDSVMGHLAK